ncbi:MAG: thiol-disulfide oxidoreductase [Leptolyngbya foveolarum]|uniref:Thiol-disulfide oxidoreductase n=1 Tax=Leptolyngbya foveolarum TaxID=47253 RepID=A0A2W4UW97_9CYAN|nr:MAG: thiol-disulfide oxidoreductase [Leptolyngbya foveolarum]
MYAVVYDGNCNLCVTLVQLLEKLDGGDRFTYVPMQDENTLAAFSVTAQDCELGMILINLDRPDQRWQGSAAAEEIGHLLPMGALFVQAYRAMPGAKSAGDKTYEYVRDNRYDLFGKRTETYQPTYPVCTDDACRPAS